MADAIHTRRPGDGVRPIDDFYPTPPECTRALLSTGELNGVDRIWEPCCGDGAIARVLMATGYDVAATDLNDHGFGTSGRDFFFEATPLAACIVTNPPFTLALDFLQRALAIGVDKVVLLLRLAFLEGRNRDGLMAPGPCRRVYPFKDRVSMYPGSWEGVRNGGMMPMGWFVFERDWNGPISIPCRLDARRFRAVSDADHSAERRASP